MDLLRRPSTRSTGSNRSISPTPTLVETPPSPTNSYTIQIYDIGNSRNSTDRSDVDSIWNVDFQESWEQRRLEDEAAAEELKTNAPVLLGAGFSVSPGQSMSRRSSRQGSKKSNPNTARSSRVSSTNNLSLAAQPLPPDLQQHRSFIGAMNHTRRQLRSLMRLKRFHLIMIALVGFDLMIVMLVVALLTAGCTTEDIYVLIMRVVEQSLTMGETRTLHASDFACTLAPSHSRELLENSIFGINLTLLSIFTIEVFVSIFSFGPLTYCRSWVSLLDATVVLTTIVLDIYFHFSTDPSSKSPIALVILRLWKVFRAVHAIAHALELHYQEVVETAERGRDKLERERISESIRLTYVRKALVKSTGADVDPVLVEEQVRKELNAMDKKRIADVAAAQDAEDA